MLQVTTTNLNKNAMANIALKKILFCSMNLYYAVVKFLYKQLIHLYEDRSNAKNTLTCVLFNLVLEAVLVSKLKIQRYPDGLEKVLSPSLCRQHSNSQNHSKII